MVHALKNLFLFVDLLIGFFLVDVALEMIFVVRLPRLRTHVTEVLTTSASYEVTPMGSFYCLFAKRTYFSILRYPLHISLFLNHPRHPPFFLFTETGMVVIALTQVAKNFATSTLYCLKVHRVNLDTVVTVNTSTELIVFASSDEHLTDLLLIFFQPFYSLRAILSQQYFDTLQKKWGMTA